MKHELSADLNRYLANVAVEYVKLHNLHWNVVGSSFKQVHEYLETLYDGFAGVMDTVAELLKIHDASPLASMKDYLAAATLQELDSAELPAVEALAVVRGDLLVLLCAFAFSIHILVIDYFAPRTDGVALSCIQFFVCGILSLFPMFLAETPVWFAILDCWIPILYAGVLSCGVAYTLQILAQKHTDPTVASLLLSLESVFAAIAGAIILHEQLAPRELAGCVLMFAAIIIAQLPSKTEREAAEDSK